MGYGRRTRALLASIFIALACHGCVVEPAAEPTSSLPAPPVEPTVGPVEPTVGPAVPAVGPAVPAVGPAVPATLIVPVAGVRPEQLQDTYTAARSEGRTHNAIDIPAPQGTPVLAAARGKILRLFTSEKGGLTIYQLGLDERTVYYYAHLDRYADGLLDGHFAGQGEVLGYVGNTGNAGEGNYHLHFAIWTISDPKHFWDGIQINPYPLLRGVG